MFIRILLHFTNRTKDVCSFLFLGGSGGLSPVPPPMYTAWDIRHLYLLLLSYLFLISWHFYLRSRASVILALPDIHKEGTQNLRVFYTNENWTFLRTTWVSPNTSFWSSLSINTIIWKLKQIQMLYNRKHHKEFHIKIKNLSATHFRLNLSFLFTILRKHNLLGGYI